MEKKSTHALTAPALNKNIETLSVPPIPLVKAWLDAYSGEAGPIIDLSQAVPNYPPHPSLREELAKIAEDLSVYGYGPIEGEDELRDVYAQNVSARYGTEVTADQTLITSGCNQAFVTAIMTVAKAGDQILLSNPFYFNHETSMEMLGIEVGSFDLSADNGMVPDIATLAAAIENNTKAIALVSPNNPTGAVYSPDLLTQIFDLCQEKGIWLILDETYRDFLKGEQSCPHTLFNRYGWQETLIQLYSFSKSFCIPGLRLGAVVAGDHVVMQMGKVMDNIQICAPRPPQIAIARLMNDLKDWREGNRQEISNRAEAMVEAMQQATEWEIIAIGAYFSYIRHPFADKSSIEVAEKLAKECGLLTIPGEFFGPGQERYLRFAFANEDATSIRQIPERLKYIKI
ncbi:aminotransferase [Sneathiella sp. P13V-1]|uniref:aminotransferase n=1 Tax=Sneathiella sp. P13V-1 TaxID=2697366 RepID=UPI00187BBF24|nr:aminotransferase [Sneathiella sp. P13V-1]MBE7637209.1 aminotransferase [Sneathiella sp. P13V-1]